MMHNSSHAGCGLTESYCFMQMMSTKRFGVCEELNRFEPVSFALAVVAIEYVDSLREINPAPEIAKAIYNNRLQEHFEILTQDLGRWWS